VPDRNVDVARTHARRAAREDAVRVSHQFERDLLGRVDEAPRGREQPPASTRPVQLQTEGCRGPAGGHEKSVMVRCLRNTHNAFRFAAGSLSGDISSRGAFTAMS